MAALTPCALLALLASLVDTVQAAYQEGFLNGLWEGVGKLLALAALVAAILWGMSLPWLALVVASARIAAAANAVQLSAAPALACAAAQSCHARGGAAALFRRQPFLSEPAGAQHRLLR